MTEILKEQFFEKNWLLKSSGVFPAKLSWWDCFLLHRYNIASGNGLVPPGTKPLHEPMCYDHIKASKRTNGLNRPFYYAAQHSLSNLNPIIVPVSEDI